MDNVEGHDLKIHEEAWSMKGCNGEDMRSQEAWRYLLTEWLKEIICLCDREWKSPKVNAVW